MAQTDPSTPSSAYTRMAPRWRLIDDILAGAERVRSQKTLYLPKYEAESDGEYGRRLASTPWRPEFKDALRGLSSKPFGQEVRVNDTAPDVIQGVLDEATNKRRGGFIDDVDSRGNSLTAFSRTFFKGAIAKGVRGILVEYPHMRAGATLADERATGARPYWVDVQAEEIIALYTATIAGKETVVHLRIKETSVEREKGGYAEVTVTRIREFDRPRIEVFDDVGTVIDVIWGATQWRLWEATTAENNKNATEWRVVEQGALSRGGKTDIPFALLWTGERKGEQEVLPPLADLADMQIELYRSMSRKEEILCYAGSPMLAGLGVGAPGDGSKLVVGPKTILFAPPGIDGATTGWEYVQPDAANIKEIREDVAGIIEDMRRLGMQPMTPRSGNITATSTSVEAAKAHSQVEEWALALKDTIEQAFVFTTEWLGVGDAIEVTVDTDFAVQPYAQAPLDALDKARARRDISQRTFWESLRRFDVLPPNFDAEEEEVALASEDAFLEEASQPLEPGAPNGAAV